MIYLPPYVVHGTHSITPESVRQHRQELHDILQDLQQENLNLNDIRSYNYFNDFYQNFQKEK
jgi:glutathione-regulated potassium-efflux system ancillary protein KefG